MTNRVDNVHNEEGWEDIVHAMGNSVESVFRKTMANKNCIWGGRCDITRSLLHDLINAGCLDLIDTQEEDNAPRLYVCQYCIGENAVKLRASDHVFFWNCLMSQILDRRLFSQRPICVRGPDFYNLFEKGWGHSNYRIEIGFHKNGRQMLLQRIQILNTMINGDNNNNEEQSQRWTIISEGGLELVRKFKKIGRLHERNMSSGFWRQFQRYA